MVDTLELLFRGDGEDLLESIPMYLSNVGVHEYETQTSVTGELGNFKVVVTCNQLKVKGGSLCKWWFGDNCKTLTRKDIEQAIESMSDALHLPMGNARVTRLDVAKNIILKYPVSVYLNRFGEVSGTTRLQMPAGIYYRKKNMCLCLYSKVDELKAHKDPIPELLQGKNVLRAEQRYLQRLPRQLGVPEVTCSMLYDEDFYIKLLVAWRNRFKSIPIISMPTIAFEDIKTKRGLQMLGISLVVKQMGGEQEFMNRIAEAQQMGKLTNKQAHDLKQVVKKVDTSFNGMVEQEIQHEFYDKIETTIKYYR